MSRVSTPPAAAGPARVSRRQILVSGALAAAPLLAGADTPWPGSPIPWRRGLRLTTTSDLKTVLARSLLPARRAPVPLAVLWPRLRCLQDLPV